MSDRDERLAAVANKLAEWIDATPLPPTDIHPVYTGHVLLCHLIETEESTRSRLTQLRDEMRNASAVMWPDVQRWSDTLDQILSGQTEP